MKPNEPHHTLLQMDPRSWRFEESAEMKAATERFDDLLEQHSASPKLTSLLRAFLNECPFHVDALHHYAMRKLDEGRPLDGYAFAQTAVATAKRAFPEEFVIGRDRLLGGWVQNRPFLRAMHGLMLAQIDIFDQIGAIKTARELLGFDYEDRMGARLVLPQLLLEEYRNAEALAVFEEPDFKETFFHVSYLKALALLRLKREEEAKDELKRSLHYYPQIARFILEPLPEPVEELGQLFVAGCVYEGWYYGIRYSHLWRFPEHARAILRELADPLAAAGWPRYFDFQR